MIGNALAWFSGSLPSLFYCVMSVLSLDYYRFKSSLHNVQSTDMSAQCHHHIFFKKINFKYKQFRSYSNGYTKIILIHYNLKSYGGIGLDCVNRHKN
jgi:hypothetical protein